MIDRDAAAALMEPLTDLVVRAGAAILAVNRPAMKIDGKADGSPVTEADLAADRIIGEGLARLVPEVPALSEERAHLAKPPYDGSFFLIDPLDGTKEFVAGRNEFTVNLALVTNGTPLLGIIGAPALGLIWRGLVGRGAERLTTGEASVRRPSRSIPAPPAARRPLDRGRQPLARRQPDRSLHCSRPGAVRQVLGSAVKFGRVAEGGADIYPRLAPTCEWDVAAGHAVVTAAGGKITDAQGADLHFGEGREGFIVPEFIAWGDPGGEIPSLRRRLSRTRFTQEAELRCGARDDPSTDPLLRQILLQLRPAQVRLPQEARGIGGKGIAVFLAAEQIKPLSRDQPEPGVAGKGDAARQIDRVVAAELGAVNIGMGDKRSAIALVAETPDRAGFGGLEVRQTDHGAGVGEIGDGVETLDGQTGVAVHDHPLGGRGPGRERTGKPAKARQGLPARR